MYSHKYDTPQSNGNPAQKGVYNRGSLGDNRTSGRPMPHIDDLKAKAQSRVDPYAPIPRLLQVADNSARQADVLLEYRRPDLAYIEYLAASEIVINAVPQNKDSPKLQMDRGRLHHLNKDLITRLNKQHERFSRIKDIITNDNKRSGVEPSATQGMSDSHEGRPPISPSARMNGNGYSEERPLSMPDGYEFVRRSVSPSKLSQEQPTTSIQRSPRAEIRRRPVVHAKPEALRARPFSSQSAQNGKYDKHDSLTERFARLRALSPSRQSNSESVNGSGHNSQLYAGVETIKMPSPTDYAAPGTSTETKQPAGTMDNPEGQRNSGLQGPRVFSTAVNGPPHPPKIPISTKPMSALPKLPSPTYSPARNAQSPLGYLPSHNESWDVGTSTGRSSSLASSTMSSQQANLTSSSQGRPATLTNGAASRARRKSVYLPHEHCITAEVLYDYLKRYRVLLIDVRSRENFDQGHIFSQSVMCVEPTALRKDMSATDLEESLILSPDVEISMFERRDEFDLVVYLDQSVSSTRFLNGVINTAEESFLRILYDALYEFNQEKPLQRPPILLQGGLDAWTDLVGSSALELSNTAATVSSHRAAKAARREQRIHIPSRASGSFLQRRRLRDYNPLDPEEERRWREKAELEGVAAEPAFEETEEDNTGAESSQNSSPHYRSYEDFLRRFPEASSLEQASMVVPARPLPPTPTYPPITTPPPVPSRPPVAIARPSYSGVQDRLVSTTANQSRSAHLPAYVPISNLPQNFRLPKTGLINFGVTCYMNATIQCLSATVLLTSFFRDDRFRGYVQNDNWKGSKGVMPELYANLVRSIWRNDVEAIRPTSLRNFCARLNREWGLDQQQDAKEFLEFLLDCLHEDLNIHWARSPLQALTTKQEEVREGMPKVIVARREWDRYQYRDKSFVSDLFAGQYASRLKCTTCNHTSTTYEAFYSISIEIPRSGKGDIRDCLRSFCAEERLSGDEVWKCPRCRTEREATKRIIFTRAPEYLVIHLKRFSASHGESARKVRTPIDFPLRDFKLDPYMLPAMGVEEAQKIKNAYGPDALGGGGGSSSNTNGESFTPTDPSMTPPYRYDTYAVMRHVGTTLTSGHYIAMVRDAARGCWKQYNDHRVTDFQPEQLSSNDRLQNEQAYIVFYQRVRRA